MGRNTYCVLKFGEFELEMPHKNLSRNGVRVKLGGRAASLLAVLVEANGELVSREELLARVWPEQTIDDSAIRVHLSALRKVLGPASDGNQVIVNEAGRGYRLALTVDQNESPKIQTTPAEDIVRINLPTRIDAIIGRDQIISTLAAELIARRLITVAGPGGIGKTTVGVEAGRLAAQKSDAASFFVDFSPLGNNGLVAPTIAFTLGLTIATSDLIKALIEQLRGQATVLVFDNCEHVLEEVSYIGESLLKALPDLMILCTSREPLGAQGEWIHRLAPLELPPIDEDFISGNIGQFPSIQLFCERAKSVRNDFVLGLQNYVAVIDICRQLDGMPLAIEFAAARMNVLSAAAISEGLKKRFDLLTKGRRTAISRHKTLRAALDWSYDLLRESAQQTLQRLSVFRSAFGAEDAQEVAVGGSIGKFDVFDELADLVEKSMLIPQFRDGDMSYRLLETTRQYAMEKLIASGEANAVRAKHAGHIASLFSNTKDLWEGKASRTQIGARSDYLDDVRSALDWALGEDGDISVGKQIVAASSSLWFSLSLPGEFITHARRLLSAIDVKADDEKSFELLAAYGHALWHKEGPGDEMRDAFEKALKVANVLHEEPLVLRAIWGIWAQQILAGDYDESLMTANGFFGRLREDDDLANRATGMHMQALSSHFSGDHKAALNLLEQVIEADKEPIRADHTNHAQIDGKIAVISLLMRIKWLTGDLQGAMSLAHACAEDAFEFKHTLSICYGLGVGSIPVAIANGEYDVARKWITALRVQTNKKGLDHWGNFADGYEAAIEGRREFPSTSSKMQCEMFEVAYKIVTGKKTQSDEIQWFSPV